MIQAATHAQDWMVDNVKPAKVFGSLASEKEVRAQDEEQVSLQLSMSYLQAN
jgi:hypothetical protein